MKLPDPLTDYFAAANTDDADRIASYFAEDASVVDEKKNYVGRPAIRAWAADTRAKTKFRSEVFKVEGEAEKPRVSAHVSGDFKGSPVDLIYQFELADGLIQSVSIA
jgi:ketosteroid isomerase-like protein